MRKIVSSFLVVLVLSAVVQPRQARAQMPAKARAFLTITGYGAGGGAILGAASMAFGQSSRAIAQGASLGLYAGIIFGTYVLVSHHQRRYGGYDDYASPYGQASDVYGDEYETDQGGGRDDGGRDSFFDRYEVLQEKFHGQNKKGTSLPPIYFNLLQYNF